MSRKHVLRLEGDSVHLPAAHPRDYMRAVAYWREVERAMFEHPRVERQASMDVGSFVRGDAARYMSDAATAVLMQARAALDAREETVEPIISLPDLRAIGEGVSFARRRFDWLDTYGEAVGIRPLEKSLRPLRERCLRVIEDQLLSSR